MRSGPGSRSSPGLRPVRWALLLCLLAVPETVLGQEILVSRQLAEADGLSVGDTVRLATTADGARSQTFRVAGIYEPTPDPARLGSVPREIRLHLPDLLDLTRPPETPAGTEHVETINVALRDPADARAFAQDVSARL